MRVLVVSLVKALSKNLHRVNRAAKKLLPNHIFSLVVFLLIITNVSLGGKRCNTYSLSRRPRTVC